MPIHIIAAVAKNNVIGKNNKLPWHNSGDLKWFKHKTLHHPVIMGRKTFESIGKALPDRTNIVLTRNVDFTATDVIVVHTIKQALMKAREHGNTVYVIGGGEVYQQFLNIAQKMYITKIIEDVDGDTYFPPIDASKYNVIIASKAGDNMQYVTYSRESNYSIFWHTASKQWRCTSDTEPFIYGNGDTPQAALEDFMDNSPMTSCDTVEELFEDLYSD